MHVVLVNRLGGLSLPRKSVVRLTDRPDMTLDVYRGRKTTVQHYKKFFLFLALTAICSTEQNQFSRFSRGSTKEHVCEIILKSGHWPTRRYHLK